jgi:5-hydroxyisourate hydrolase-like protein (transthyretin family)
VVGSDNKPIANAYLVVDIFTGKDYKTHYLSTNSKGIASYGVSALSPGRHKVVISIDCDINTGLYGHDVKSHITINKVIVKIKASKLSTTYKSGKYFITKIINSKTKKGISGVKVILKVYTGKKAKTVTLTSNSKGNVKYQSSKLDIGKHKIVLKVKSTTKITGITKTSYIKVYRAALNISAPFKTKLYKKAGRFTVTVKNKASGKAVKGIKVIMKVYTGKKYKTFTAKTNSKGKAGFSTKSLSKGYHKVKITAKGNSKYKKASAKGVVEIIKKKFSTRIRVNDASKLLCWKSPKVSSTGEVIGYKEHYNATVDFTPTLKDAYGHKLKGNYKAELFYFDSTNVGVLIKTYSGKFGKHVHDSFKGYQFGHYELTIIFAGNDRYKASELTILTLE